MVMILSFYRVMAELTCTEQETKKWALHSMADAVHDGGEEILDNGINLKSIFVELDKEPITYNEDAIVQQLLKTIEEKDQREKEIFLVREETALFAKNGSFQLAKTCDTESKTLVYQDAGPTVYDLVCNGVNALNPGSVCDPATRPKEVASFSRFKDDFEIDGCVFGFNQDVVKSVLLRNFTGRSVVCGVQFNEGWYDMAAGKFVTRKENVQTVKHINIPSGFLSGNGVNKTLKPDTPNVKLFYIGKLLGDALQVITMLKTINKKDNPYYQIQEKGEDTQLINTHDRLQYARAVVLGIGALRTFLKNNVKQAAYTPGLGKALTPQDYVRLIKESYETIIGNFDKALRSMRDSISNRKIIFKCGYSKIKYFRIQSEPEKKEARKFMLRCIIKTREIKQEILKKFSYALLVKETDEPDKLKRKYQSIYSQIASRSPPGSILNKTGNVISPFKVAITDGGDRIIDFAHAFGQMEDELKGKGTPYGIRRNEWLKPDKEDESEEESEDDSQPEPQPKRGRTAGGGKRKGRKGTFRKKGGAKRKLDPATEGVKAVNAFISKVYAEEARIIGFDEDGNLIQVPDGDRFWKEEKAKSTEYKPNIQVPADEAKEIEDGFNYVPPDGVDVTWQDMLIANLKENKDSLLVGFIRFITPEVRTDLAVENEVDIKSDNVPSTPPPEPASEKPVPPSAASTATVNASAVVSGNPTPERPIGGADEKQENPIVTAFLKAKILIEDAVESECKKNATTVQDTVVLGSLKKQLDLFLYSLTGVPEMVLPEGAKEAPEEIFAVFPSEGPEDDNMGEQAKPIPEPGSPPRQPVPQNNGSPGDPIGRSPGNRETQLGSTQASEPASGATSDSDVKITGDSFVPPPPPRAPGGPTGGKRRTRRMKRLFR